MSHVSAIYPTTKLTKGEAQGAPVTGPALAGEFLVTRFGFVRPMPGNWGA